MKILFVTSWFPNPWQEKDGNFIGEHALALESLGHEVQIVHELPSNRFLFPKIKKDQFKGLTIWRIELPKWMLRNFQFRQKLAGRIFHSMRCEGFVPDIVHGQVLIPVLPVAAHFQSLFQKPMVFTEHWSGYTQIEFPVDQSRLFEKLKSSFGPISRILPVSTYLQESLKKRGVDRPCQVVFNTVNTEIFKYIEKHHNPIFTFLHVSGFSDVKNVEGIIEAFHKLVKSDVTKFYRLIIAGDGDLARIERYCKSNISNECDIQLIGALDYTGVAELMRQSDCFVLFSKMETFSCVAAEALCCGLPVITSRVGAMPERIDSSNGVLVEPERVDLLMASMQRMALDFGRYNRQSIADNASFRYSYTRIAGELTTVYDEVITEFERGKSARS